MSESRRGLVTSVCLAFVIGLAACGTDAAEESPSVSESTTSDEVATTVADATDASVGAASTTTVETATNTSSTVASVGTIQMAGGDVLDVGPIGDVVEAVDLSDSTVVRCPPGRDSEGSLAVMVRTDSVIFLASINEITFSHHSVMVYEEGVGRFESEATSSLNRSQWFDNDGNELPGPLITVDGDRLAGSATLTVDGFEETRQLEFDLPLPDEIADPSDCVR